MATDRQATKAMELLAQLAPAEVLKKARDLAREIVRDDYVRDYMARWALVVVITGIAAAAFSSLLVAAAAVLVSPLVHSYAPWLGWLMPVLAVALWIGGSLLPMLPLLRWLRRRALRQLAEMEADRRCD